MIFHNASIVPNDFYTTLYGHYARIPGRQSWVTWAVVNEHMEWLRTLPPEPPPHNPYPAISLSWYLGGQKK